MQGTVHQNIVGHYRYVSLVLDRRSRLFGPSYIPTPLVFCVVYIPERYDLRLSPFFLSSVTFSSPVAISQPPSIPPKTGIFDKNK